MRTEKSSTTPEYQIMGKNVVLCHNNKFFFPMTFYVCCSSLQFIELQEHGDKIQKKIKF